jgi:hypothetical protein
LEAWGHEIELAEILLCSTVIEIEIELKLGFAWLGFVWLCLVGEEKK